MAVFARWRCRVILCIYHSSVCCPFSAMIISIFRARSRHSAQWLLGSTTTALIGSATRRDCFSVEYGCTASHPNNSSPRLKLSTGYSMFPSANTFLTRQFGEHIVVNISLFNVLQPYWIFNRHCCQATATGSSYYQ